jgi:predicted ATP-grasp superfamily ATP-dependent carboligase
MVGNYRPSLAVARALSAAGYRVIGGDGGEFKAFAVSRHCHEVWPHPPIADKPRFLDALTAYLAARPDVTTVLPLDEPYLAAFAEDRTTLPGGVVLAIPDPETVLTCLSKPAMYAMAEEAQVPYLPLAVARDYESVVATCERIGYPVIIRPTGREVRPDESELKAAISLSEGEVRQAWGRWQQYDLELVVQRYVEAPRHNVYFAARAGRVLAWSESRIVHTDRPDGTGENVHAVTVEPDPRVTRWTRALVKQLDYTGVGLAQFLMPAGRDPYFMEMNPRIGAGVALPQSLGLDLAVAACELATPGNTWRPDPGYSELIGKRYVWTSGAIRGLLIADRRGELSKRELLGSLIRTTITAVRADVHATWSVRDPRPTLFILTNRLRRGRRSSPQV